MLLYVLLLTIPSVYAARCLIGEKRVVEGAGVCDKFTCHAHWHHRKPRNNACACTYSPDTGFYIRSHSVENIHQRFNGSYSLRELSTTPIPGLLEFARPAFTRAGAKAEKCNEESKKYQILALFTQLQPKYASLAKNGPVEITIKSYVIAGGNATIPQDGFLQLDLWTEEVCYGGITEEDILYSILLKFNLHNCTSKSQNNQFSQTIGISLGGSFGFILLLAIGAIFVWKRKISSTRGGVEEEPFVVNSEDFLNDASAEDLMRLEENFPIFSNYSAPIVPPEAN